MRLSLLLKGIRFYEMAGEFLPKRMRLNNAGNNKEKDQSYFESYADITVHEEMLGDDIRTNAYKNAIFNFPDVFRNKVVLDVGAGTGILSCFCAKGGAKKVYAVEASSIAVQAKKVVESNELQDQITVIQGVMEDIELPEKVDVIISEWMGYCLLYESMFSSVIVARDRWLKPRGIMLPDSASIYLAPICDDEIMVEKVNFWNDMEEVYGVNMSCLLPFARTSLSKDVMVKSISCENVLSHPQLIKRFNLYTTNQSEIKEVAHSFTFSSFGIADLQGFALWFDVTFHKILTEHQVLKCDMVEYNNHVLAHDNILSTSPYKSETHWKQSLLYLNKEVEIEQDSKISGDIIIAPCPDNNRFLNITVNCKVDHSDVIQKSYFMGYELPKNKDVIGKI